MKCLHQGGNCKLTDILNIDGTILQDLLPCMDCDYLFDKGKLPRLGIHEKIFLFSLYLEQQKNLFGLSSYLSISNENFLSYKTKFPKRKFDIFKKLTTHKFITKEYIPSGYEIPKKQEYYIPHFEIVDEQLRKGYLYMTPDNVIVEKLDLHRFNKSLPKEMVIQPDRKSNIWHIICGHTNRLLFDVLVSLNPKYTVVTAYNYQNYASWYMTKHYSKKTFAKLTPFAIKLIEDQPLPFINTFLKTFGSQGYTDNAKDKIYKDFVSTDEIYKDFLRQLKYNNLTVTYMEEFSSLRNVSGAQIERFFSKVEKNELSSITRKMNHLNWDAFLKSVNRNPSNEYLTKKFKENCHNQLSTLVSQMQAAQDFTYHQQIVEKAQEVLKLLSSANAF
ncbi:hypothetical protein UABAM_05020 [Candidatus Uabimicrobium amorphum]|uniref:Uncharacterized protein n=2 Tax=Uabimicrobium amorphum TaxID=2596890 RepID=A0A5S9IRM6_UABAM|nr:hypothetical protein UABAM_05020 [Candidatus Uabimicrobium amorphum]